MKRNKTEKKKKAMLIITRKISWTAGYYFVVIISE